MNYRSSRCLRTFFVGCGVFALVYGLELQVPEADAGPQRGGGSVRHSGRSGSKSSAQRGSTSGARKGSQAGGKAGSRTGATKGASKTGTRQGASAGGRGGSSRKASSGGRRHGHGNARYSNRKSARRDYRRFRTVTRLVVAGVYLATRPKYSTTVVVTGTTYYYAGGTYYVVQGSNYVVVAPPPGAVVYAVPTVTTVVYVGQTPYFYYNGTYYVATEKPAEAPEVAEADMTVVADTGSQDSDDLKTVTSTVTPKDGEEMELPPMPVNDEQNYEVIAPPVGATVPYLPDLAEEKTIGGKAYFAYEDTYYKPFASDGETIYMVVDDPNTAGE